VIAPIMRISCGTTWAKRWPLEQAVDLVVRAGYSAIDLTFTGEAEMDAALAVMRQNALAINSVTVEWPGHESSDSLLFRALNWSRKAGVSAWTVVTGERRQGSIQELASRLQCVLAACAGMNCAVINRLGRRIEQLEDLRELFVRVADPRLRVVIDTLEFHRASVDPRAAVDELADRADRLILADAIGCRQVPLGEGEMNVASILAHARDRGGINSLSLVPQVTSASNAVEELAAERHRLEALCAAI